MLPNGFEKEAVDEAFELIKSTSFDSDQREFLRYFLEQNARDPLNNDQLNQVFGDKIKIIDAIKNLYDYAKHYENEEKAFNPFKQKIKDILLNLPEKSRLRP